MTSPVRSESLLDAYGQTLLELGEQNPAIVVFNAHAAAPTGAEPFGRKFPERFHSAVGSPSEMMARAAERATDGGTAFASASAILAAGDAYLAVRQSVCARRANVKIVANHGGPIDPDPDGVRPFVEDVALMRGLPGMTVVVPADAPTTRSAIRAIADRAGPAYVRLSRADLPTVTDGRFAIGKAAELRTGDDLTIVAVGGMLARGLEVAEELGRSGLSVRLLDFASVKPFDEPALLRAARDTGAILVLEEQSVLTGVGAIVASTTSENYPVPVRRIGVPDLFGDTADPSSLLDRYGMSIDRIRDEAWELLRARGKVQ